MLEFRVEWQEAPGVRDSLLARTWARLEIWVQGKPAIQLFDTELSSVHYGVYGSMFPLASWIVENWWNLLHEHAFAASLFEGARAAFAKNPNGYRAWLQRHSLLAAREGYALPDMSIFRDEDRIFLRWVPDPFIDGQRRRFLGEGSARLPPDAVQKGLANLVTCVVDRVSSEQAVEARELCENWSAVLHSETDEPRLCEALAALGEDPYDPEGLSEEVRDLVENKVNTLDPLLREDLLHATSRRSLRADCERIAGLVDALDHDTSFAQAWRAFDTPKSPWPHLDGYRRAANARRALGLAPTEMIPDLPTTIERHLGSFAYILRGDDTIRGSRVDALLGANQDRQRTLVAPDRGHTAQRFLLARALHHWMYTIHNGNKRLLTHGHGWEQRASRAFAAELLAPASALQERLEQDPDIDATKLAGEFAVSPMVITHQLDNHGLI